MHHVTKLESFQIVFEHDNEFTVLKWPPQSPDLNPIEHLWDVVERELRALDVHHTNLHQLQDAILKIWANISKECSQYFVESMPRRIKAVLKAKEGQTQCYYGIPNNPLAECMCILHPFILSDRNDSFRGKSMSILILFLSIFFFDLPDLTTHSSGTAESINLVPLVFQVYTSLCHVCLFHISPFPFICPWFSSVRAAQVRRV